MTNTVEFTVMQVLNDDLQLAIKNDIIAFSGKLFANNLINQDEYEDARNGKNSKRERVSGLIDAVRANVQKNRLNFKTLIQVFDSDRAQYSDILKKIDEAMTEYKGGLHAVAITLINIMLFCTIIIARVD